MYCNTIDFIGYETLNAPGYLLFSASSSKGAPNSNGNNCSLATEDVDVNLINFWKNYYL